MLIRVGFLTQLCLLVFFIEKVGNLIINSCTCMHVYTNYFADTCTFPSPPNNGAIANFSSTEEGTMVTFQCNNGFTPIQKMISKCLADGSWEVNPLSLKCTALKKSGSHKFILAIAMRLNHIQ